MSGIPSGMLSAFNKPAKIKPVEPAPEPLTIESTAVAVPQTTQALAAEENSATTPEGFRALLDVFDAQMEKSFDSLAFDETREMAKRMMIELKTYPEFDGIVQDKDLRNLFMFLQQTAEQLAFDNSIKADKAEKKSRKKKAAVTFNFDALPKNLEELGQTSIDPNDPDHINKILGIE